MKKLNVKLTAAVFLLAAVTLFSGFAQKANITYVEGTSNIKSAAGKLRAADFGGTVTYGESVITGKDGLVEMQLENGSTIKVTPSSVFGYSSTGTGAESRTVLATTAGKVSYKLNKVAGKSPVIQTNSMVAGVRGTEFEVYAGRDGSVMLAVTGGIVDVESQGQMVSLEKNEAVEVTPGEAPGEKFVFLGREKNFSDWNKGKMDEFFADPVAGLAKVEEQLAGYKEALEALKGPYETATAEWKTATEKYKTITAAGDETASKAYQKDILFPAQLLRATLIMNIRYHALNYLSVRRFVVSNMYMEMKSRYPVASDAAVLTFFKQHGMILSEYEENIVPDLNENDY